MLFFLIGFECVMYRPSSVLVSLFLFTCLSPITYLSLTYQFIKGRTCKTVLDVITNRAELWRCNKMTLVQQARNLADS